MVAGLRERGYVEGQNIVIEQRWADGKYERLPGLAAELVQMKVDVIVAATTVAIRAAQQATTTTPIIMVRTPDPAGMGLVASLSRPGGNTTGLSSVTVEVAGKYLELLRAAVPKLSRVTVVLNPTSPSHPELLKRILATQKSNNVTIMQARASTAGEIEEAFAAMKHERPDGLIVMGDPVFASHARRMAELAAQHRLPAIFASRQYAESGGLMSYGQHLTEQYFRAATYVDKILKGAKPGDLPVEQPTKFELVINLKTAKAIGIKIPQSILQRADKVIE